MHFVILGLTSLLLLLNAIVIGMILWLKVMMLTFSGKRLFSCIKLESRKSISFFVQMALFFVVLMI